MSPTALAGDTVAAPVNTVPNTQLRAADLANTNLFDGDLLENDDELLIEEISIDGMCGVY